MIIDISISLFSSFKSYFNLSNASYQKTAACLCSILPVNYTSFFHNNTHTNDLRRITSNNSIWEDIFRYDTTGTHDARITNLHSWHNNRSNTYNTIITYMCICFIIPTCIM